MIGLLGAHRTGKTSLAQSYAKKHGIVFLETPVSVIFKELGYSPSDQFDFGTRLMIQEVILERLDAMYANMAGVQAICDRTPIDLMGYTLAEVHGHAVAPEEQARLARYIARCYEVLNKRFTALLLIQPGIPVVPAEGKAPLSAGYIEHLNSLMLGLACDQRVKIPHYYLMREVTDMEDRIGRLENVVMKVQYALGQSSAQHRESGGMFH